MITCHVRYVIDPNLISEFEAYAKMWIPLVERFGGKHHGYFLPAEGANNIALALFSFPSPRRIRKLSRRFSARFGMPGCVRVRQENQMRAEQRT
jgi:hypothetical protein